MVYSRLVGYYRGESKGNDPRLKLLSMAWAREWGVGVGGGYPPGHGVEIFEK